MYRDECGPKTTVAKFEGLTKKILIGKNLNVNNIII